MNDHVVLRWHVAGDALGTCAARFVLMVFWGFKVVGVVTTQAERITFCTQFLRMRFVAIHARHTALEHLALQERAPNIDLLPLLAVRVIIGGGEHGHAMTVFQRGPCLVPFADG